MKIQLSDHFSYGRLLRFTAPSIAMMIFTSVYGVVDGFFVSNYAGKTPFAAVNLIMPFLMVDSHGRASCSAPAAPRIVAKSVRRGRAGAGEPELFALRVRVLRPGRGASRCWASSSSGPSAMLLGAEGELLDNCVRLRQDYPCWRCPSTCCSCCSRAFSSPPKSPSWG